MGIIIYGIVAAIVCLFRILQLKKENLLRIDSVIFSVMEGLLFPIFIVAFLVNEIINIKNHGR